MNKKRQLQLSSRLFTDFVKPNWQLLITSIFFALLSGACTLVVVKLIKPIIDDIFINKQANRLFEISFIFLFSSVCKAIGDYGESFYVQKFSQIITKKFKLQLFSHLIKCDLEYFHSRPIGRLISILSNDINTISNTVRVAVLNFCKDAFVLTGIILYLFMNDPYFTIIACIGFVLSVFPTFRIGRKVRTLTTFTHERFGDWVSFISQVFNGIRLVKTYNMEQFEENKALTITENIYQMSLKSARTQSLAHPIMELIMGVAISAIIFIGGSLVIAETRTSGTLLSYLAALMFAYTPAKQLFHSGTLFQECMAAAKRIYAILDVDIRIKQLSSANNHIQNGCIEFKDVTFSYSSGTQILKNLTFSINSGEKIAIVGPSGAGKSTIINLIPRLYDARSGMILIDGIDIKDFKFRDLRNGISLVSQDIILFNDTIYENIKYGNQDASYEQIVKASQLAMAYDFITRLPLSFDTIVGDNGVLLSGGQKQRISIARAILKNSPILLLDEATSALDTEAEKSIQQALDNLMVGKTTLIVAHRLSTVINSDRIFVLSNGEIVEDGKHAELIVKNGIYAALYNKQSTALE